MEVFIRGPPGLENQEFMLVLQKTWVWGAGDLPDCCGLMRKPALWVWRAAVCSFKRLPEWTTYVTRSGL